MIRKMKWNDYVQLGNLYLDFSKPDGGIYETVVLAGENGTGKTTILETLSDYLNGFSLKPFDYIHYLVDGEEYIITPDQQFGHIGFCKRKNLKTKSEERVNYARNNNFQKIDQDRFDLRHYGFAYTKARSGFNTHPVKTMTTQQLDSEKYEVDNDDDFTRIKQLLIDIDGQDASEWKRESEKKGLCDKKYDDFIKKSRGYRFEKAFNDFFDDVEYVGIDNNDPNEKKVLFKKHNKIIPVDSLSTGEKQIVFRGAHLLRNLNNIPGGIVLIDEPELSMHPVWQKKILDYYRGIFTHDGNQTVQMIIATHSEYVIQSALKDRDNVLVIVLNDNSGTITAKSVTAPNVLPSITAAETNYLAFGVPSTDYHIELYGYLQSKTGNNNVAACDQYIARHAKYDATKHEKLDNYETHHYQTLPTYIRNAIDHPDSGRHYTDEQFRLSIELLIELCK